MQPAPKLQLGYLVLERAVLPYCPPVAVEHYELLLLLLSVLPYDTSSLLAAQALFETYTKSIKKFQSKLRRVIKFLPTTQCSSKFEFLSSRNIYFKGKPYVGTNGLGFFVVESSALFVQFFCDAPAGFST